MERLRIFSPAISLPITRPAAVSCSQVIFGASDFNDFISRVFYIDKVTSAQSDAIETVRTLKAQLEEQQEETEARLENAQKKVDEQA